MKTLGRLEMQTPFNDGQIFIGANLCTPLVAASAPLGSSGAGLLTLNIPVSTTANIYVSLSSLLRTGQLATAAINQEEFGTAALVPGPSSVANTSDPLNLPAGFSPQFASALNPALTGGYKGPIPKGLQINWVDTIYAVNAAAISSASVGLTSTKYAAANSNAAPVVTNIIALGTNGLIGGPTTAYRSRAVVSSPAFISGDGVEIIYNFNVTTSGSSTVNFYGISLGVSFNYN